MYAVDAAIPISARGAGPGELGARARLPAAWLVLLLASAIHQAALAQPGAAALARIPGVSAADCRSVSGERPWLDPNQPPACRALEVIAAMTFDEKLAEIGGITGKSTAARLGLLSGGGADGPNGVAGGGVFPVLEPRSLNVTAFPTALTLSATWDRALARRYGTALAGEFRGKGMDSVLGPTVNILRTWRWGRAGETFSEDPFLTAEMVVPEIEALQSGRVLAVVKHYAGNNQEIGRVGVAPDHAGIDERITEKALHEIYLPAFEAAVSRAHAGGVMCAYNRIDGEFSCNDAALLGQLRRWGFDGFVTPDAIYALRDPLAGARAGVDRIAGEQVRGLIERGELPMSALDRMLFHDLLPYFRLGLYDSPPEGKPDANVATPEHAKLAREVASAGAVLLRNDGVLPLDPSRVRSVAVIGDDAGPGATVMESGSAHVDVARLETPLAGIEARAGAAVKVIYAAGTRGVGPLPPVPSAAWRPPSGEGHGLLGRYYASADGSGPATTRIDAAIDFAEAPMPEPAAGPAAPTSPSASTSPGASSASAPPAAAAPGGAPSRRRRAWSARWTGTLTPPTTGPYRFSVTGGGTARLYVANRRVATLMRADFPMTAQGVVDLVAGLAVPVELEYSSASNLLGRGLRLGWQPPDPALAAQAVAAARRADVAVVFAAKPMGEGHDALSLKLPGDQDALIEAVARANPRTIVVLHTSNPVAMPWLDEVAAVIEAWYPGQAAGSSIASVLFGDVDPSGRLPMTFPADEGQGPGAHWLEYPGDGETVDFDEGVLVGYRWYDAKRQTPLFPFGYGLSYTRFELRDLELRGSGAGRSIAVRVTNRGTRAGAEVVQLYVSFPPAAEEPPRQLKGFAKLLLAPAESRVVTMSLADASLKTWNEVSHRQEVYPGTYTVGVGESSRSLPLRAIFEIAER